MDNTNEKTAPCPIGFKTNVLFKNVIGYCLSVSDEAQLSAKWGITEKEGLAESPYENLLSSVCGERRIGESGGLILSFRLTEEFSAFLERCYRSLLRQKNLAFYLEDLTLFQGGRPIYRECTGRGTCEMDCGIAAAVREKFIDGLRDERFFRIAEKYRTLSIGDRRYMKDKSIKTISDIGRLKSTDMGDFLTRQGMGFAHSCGYLPFEDRLSFSQFVKLAESVLCGDVAEQLKRAGHFKDVPDELIKKIEEDSMRLYQVIETLGVD